MFPKNAHFLYEKSEFHCILGVEFLTLNWKLLAYQQPKVGRERVFGLLRTNSTAKCATRPTPHAIQEPSVFFNIGVLFFEGEFPPFTHQRKDLANVKSR